MPILFLLQSKLGPESFGFSHIIFVWLWPGRYNSEWCMEALNTHAQVLRHEVPDMTMIGICRTCSVYARNYQYSLLITSWCQLWSSHTQCQNGYNKACPSSLPCSNYLVQKFRPNLSCQFNPFSGNLSDDCRLRHDDHHLVAKCLFYPTNM